MDRTVVTLVEQVGGDLAHPIEVLLTRHLAVEEEAHSTDGPVVRLLVLVLETLPEVESDGQVPRLFKSLRPCASGLFSTGIFPSGSVRRPWFR